MIKHYAYQISKSKRAVLALALSAACSLTLSATNSAIAVPKEQREKEWGNANIAARANLAARAFQDGNFQNAIAGYRALIGLNPNEPDFYLALYSSAYKGGNWKQAALAFDELFDKCPEYKGKLAALYADVLQRADRGDEAKDAEKIAKKSPGDPGLVDTRVSALIEKSVFDEPKAELPKPPVIPKRNVVKPEEVNANTSKYALNYETAFWSENIVIAEYLGHEKAGAITYFRPPKAYYRIEKRIKGAPLNPHLTIRYEFSDKTNNEKPADWKFDESIMPKKGSKWILFIPNAVPFEGALETYHGSYGRQEYNDENFDKLMKIIELHKGQTR